MPISVVGLLLLIKWWFTPVSLTQEDIIGRWEIHRKMYPGENADWQRENFWIEINSEKLIIYDNSNKIPITVSATVDWFHSPQYRFRVLTTSPHHLLTSGGPSIYRGYKGYYLVFKSSQYGNMFFEHVSD